MHVSVALFYFEGPGSCCGLSCFPVPLHSDYLHVIHLCGDSSPPQCLCGLCFGLFGTIFWTWPSPVSQNWVLIVLNLLSPMISTFCFIVIDLVGGVTCTHAGDLLPHHVCDITGH